MLITLSALKVKRLHWYGDPSKGQLQKRTQNKTYFIKKKKKNFHPVLSLHNYRDKL